MRKLIILLFTMITFASCSNIDTKVDAQKSKKMTTVKILELTNADTSCYKYVEIDNVSYIIKDNTVVYRIENQSGKVDTIILIISVVMIFIGIFAIQSRLTD